MPKRLLAFLPALIAVGVGGFFLWALVSGRDASILPSVLINEPAPQFALAPVEDVDRPGVSREDLLGQVTLVNFFASWCIPCLAEHPLITRMAEDGLPVFGINYKNEPTEARNWLRKYGNPYTRIGSDYDGRTGIEFGVVALPESFVIDQNGVIRYKQVGVITPDDLENIILPLIAVLQKEGVANEGADPL